MNNFKIKQFWKTLSWYVRVNMKTLLIWIVGAVSYVFVGEMLMLSFGAYSHPYPMIRDFAAIGGGTFMIVMLVMIASVTTGINKKNAREAFLMLPATNLEKYLALVTYTSVICTLCFFAAMIAGDTLRMVCMWLKDAQDVCEGSYQWWSSAIPQLFDNLIPSFSPGPNTTYTTGLMVMQYLSCISVLAWIHSLFLLGGTLLRKNAFAFSSLLLILSVWLYLWTYRTIGMDTYHVTHQLAGGTVEHTILGAGYGLFMTVLFASCLSLFNYWASFRIFKGFQFITNKYTNYDILKR